MSKTNSLISSRLPDIGTSIFSEMSALARQTGAINLSQGFPEFDTPEFLKQAVIQAIQSGNNQYAPSIGMPQLLEQIGALVERHYQLKIDPLKQATVVSGATEAIFVAVQSLVRQGDEVIIFDPAYDAYEPAIQMAGGKPVHIAMRAPDYTIDWQQVADKVNSKTKAIVINTPHNPTGTLLQQTDMLALQKIVCDNNLYLISDEVYEFIIFDGERHESVLRYPELFERSFTISSFGKTFHATGWKMGYAVAPAELTEEFRKIHQFVTFVSNTPVQLGLASMLEKHPEHIAGLAAFYQQKRDQLMDLLADSRFKILPAKGTYFILADYSQISELSDREFCYWLAKEKGVAAVPLSPFYAEKISDKNIRLCFAKHLQTMQLSGEKLCQL